MIFFSKDTLRSQVEAATGGLVTVLYDDKGNPSYMRVIPKFTYESLGFETEFGTGVHEAFLVNGVEKPYIMIGQYLASNFGSRPCSLPGKDPWNTIDFDDAKNNCAAKGQGWHLMTNWEWSAVALWCAANGFQPSGNTDRGRHHTLTHEVGLRPDGALPGVSEGNGRTLTGSGPASWRHDNTFAGIADLVGNVTEWNNLVKLVDGSIILAPDNDYTLDEASWVDTEVNLVDSNPWTSSTVTGTQLTNRALVTYNGVDITGRLYTSAGGERMCFRGGLYSRTSFAGLGNLNLNSERTSTHGGHGFRLAFL